MATVEKQITGHHPNTDDPTLVKNKLFYKVLQTYLLVTLITYLQCLLPSELQSLVSLQGVSV